MKLNLRANKANPQNAEPEVVVGKTSHFGGRLSQVDWSRLKPGKKTLALELLALVAVALIAWLVYWLLQPKPVFSVAGHDYYAEEVNDLIKYPTTTKHLSRDQATKLAYDYLRRQAAAEQLRLAPSRDAIAAAKQAVLGDLPPASLVKDPWTELAAFNLALKDELANSDGHVYHGYSFVFWFGRHWSKSYDYTDPHYGDQKLIAKDKAYAKSRAEHYHQQLVSHKISPDQALREIQKDDRLNDSTELPFSAKFEPGNNKPLESQVFFLDIAKFIEQKAKPGLSKIQTGQSAVVPAPQSAKDYKDTYFYFVDLNQSAQLSTKQFDQQVNKVESNYNGW